MDTDTFKVGQVSEGGSMVNDRSIRDRLGSIGFYVFLVTLVIAPLIFWPSTYMALDTVKTAVIGLGVIISAILLGFSAIQNKKLVLPPKRIFWVGVSLIISLVVSALFSIHISKSMFGQGFELNTASFMILMFLAGLVAFEVIRRKSDRAILLYVGIFVAYVINLIFQILRLTFGQDFMSFGIFTSKVGSLLGNWSDLGTVSLIVALLSFSATTFLPLSRRMKITYWIFTVVSMLVAFIVNNPRAWGTAFVVLLGFAILMSVRQVRLGDRNPRSIMRHIAWVPIVLSLVAGVLSYRGDQLSQSITNYLGVTYSEVHLPWQATLDVTASAIKQSPILGVGANHFLENYLRNKPYDINLYDSWSIDFSHGFGLIPTLIAEQGVLGLVLWILFFVFLGLAGHTVFGKVGRDREDRSPRRFIVTSSYLLSVFLWLMATISIPSHAVLLLTFVVTGIFFGVSVSDWTLQPVTIEPRSSGRSRMYIIAMIVMIIIAVAWGFIYVKKFVALSYFGKGARELTSLNNPDLALTAFTTADKIDHLDIYNQGKAEAELSRAAIFAAEATKASNAGNASTSAEFVKQLGDAVNRALLDARSAIAYDPNDYYNYISEARVSEVALNLKMQNAYDNAVAAYANAIKLNPGNPSIYLNLARLEINQNKLDDAIRTIGQALQVKPNYLDAVFTLSQVYAANGNLDDAIVAAKFAIQLNPQNQLLYFQLGLLEYNNKDYNSAIEALSSAIKLQADYANAQYFLGLSYARIGKNAEAIAQFDQLSKTNPDNQEVLTILKNLSAGKSIFGSTQTVTSPEKRSSPPIKAKK